MATQRGFGQSAFRSYLLASQVFGDWLQRVEVLIDLICKLVNSNSEVPSRLDHIYSAILVYLHLETSSNAYLYQSNDHQNFDRLSVSGSTLAILSLHSLKASPLHSWWRSRCSVARCLSQAFAPHVNPTICGNQTSSKYRFAANPLWVTLAYFSACLWASSSRYSSLSGAMCLYHLAPFLLPWHSPRSSSPRQCSFVIESSAAISRSVSTYCYSSWWQIKKPAVVPPTVLCLMNQHRLLLFYLLINIDAWVNCYYCYSFNLVPRFHLVAPWAVHDWSAAPSAIQLEQINDPYSNAGFK